MGVVTRFKRRRVFTLVESGVSILTIKDHMVEFPLHELLALPAEVAIVGHYTRAIPEEAEFKDFFSTSLLVNLPSVSPP
jgi:hypothetical protein